MKKVFILNDRRNIREGMTNSKAQMSNQCRMARMNTAKTLNKAGLPQFDVQDVWDTPHGMGQARREKRLNRGAEGGRGSGLSGFSNTLNEV
jgi:hypothetical protein